MTPAGVFSEDCIHQRVGPAPAGPFIGYHFGWNAFSSSVFGLKVSGFEADASIFATTLNGPDWLTGGQYGFEGSIPALIADVLTPGVALRLLGGQRSTDFA